MEFVFWQKSGAGAKLRHQLCLQSEPDSHNNYDYCRQPPLAAIRAILSGQTGTSPAINRYAAKGSLHE